MADQNISQSLAERALQRLRKIASGNGIEPMAITLLEAQENVFALAGLMEVSPLCETQATTYAGLPRGKDRKIVKDAAALQNAVAQHRAEFQQSPDWIREVRDEIVAHAGQGWGLENAKVTLPKKSAVFAAPQLCPTCEGRATLTCTQCNGQGTVICNQCQGQGRELCYHCGGRGEDPQQPGQRCHTCGGTRYAPCRFCQTHRYLTCPTCQGRRGTPCPGCNGTGKITQEVSVTCGAETHFKLLNTDSYPSGLRRGLERIGISNLAKGHADIATSPPPPATEEEEDNRRGSFPILLYKVTLPYAEMRVTIGSKKAVISAVGKRCAVNGVPNFLDESLKVWREHLRQAAQGSGRLEDALGARAISDMLALMVAGKDQVEDVRRAYPFGISTDVIESMLADMRVALRQVTLKTRAIIAALCAVLGDTLFYVVFARGWQNQLTQNWPRYSDLLADIALLALVIATSWITLSLSTRIVLQRRFPKLAIGLQQQIGKIGWAMFGALGTGFVLALALSPVKPDWLAAFMP